MEKPLTGHIRPGGEPLSLADFERVGGYASVRKALKTMAPEEVTRVVSNSGLRGRGGAGFLAGMKWSFVPMGKDAPRPKYLVCNADEMEPGTFKDRYLMEGNPHQLVEALIVSAYAIGAEVAFIFLRAEYALSRRRLERALAEARAGGYLGPNILGSGFALEVRIHTSAGRYICGEETALLNALEGRRAIPRAKP
ncbi:MAG: NADH-quinone oxidoreductase subunit F, partial [Verrucomicrobia bacterium]|nr:NADH-quinone oxidoreductase subunit F [Verrucomicrobiota bacterium]